MRAQLLLVAGLLILSSTPASARVARAMGRRPDLPARLQAPRVWTERSGLFSVRRPESELWRFEGGARDAEGGKIPLLARSDESGATVSVQSADGVPSAKALVRLLAERLEVESKVKVDEPQAIATRGGDGFGFTFTSGGEQRGRVAVVPAGEHLLLIVASWPLGSPPQVIDDVDSMIRSVGPASE